MEGEGEETSPTPPPPRLVRVKMEVEYPPNNLELQMEELQADFDEGRHAEEAEEEESQEDYVPMPLLYPEPPSGLDRNEIQNGHDGMSMDEEYLNMEHQQLPATDDGNFWYQCKHCSILLEDVMSFLFHVRVHADPAIPGSGELGMDTPSLEKELSEAGVRIFSPVIITPKISGDETNVKTPLPPLPRLTRAPSTSTLTLSDQLPENTLLTEHLPRKCKLCVPHLHFSRRQEFIDHLFQKHRLDKEFRCSKTGCRYRTRSVQFIESHMENHPEPYSRIYTCHLCTPKTRWYQSTRYAQHMRVHLGKDGKYSCLYCSYSTTGLQLLNKHNKKKHPETGNGEVDVTGSRGPNPYKAPVARPLSSLVQPPVVQRPVKVRDGRGQGQQGRQFLCYFCSKAWLSRKQYESHMILRHRNSHGGYNCHQCTFEADSIRIIARHFKYKHDGVMLRNELSQGENSLDMNYNNGEVMSEEEGDFDMGDEFETEEEDPLFHQDEGEEYEDPEEYEEPIPQAPITSGSGIVSKTPLVLSPPSGFTLARSGSPAVVNNSEVSCPLCREAIPMGSYQKYFDHMFQIHCNDNAVYCPQCQFRSTSLEMIILHTASAHPTPVPVSQNNTTKSPNPLQPTTSSLSPSKSTFGQAKLNYLCRFCKSIWSEVGAYSAHMKKHLDGNGHYRCPYCHLPYPTLNRFNEHVKRRHEMGQPPSRLSMATSQGQDHKAGILGPTHAAVSRRLSSLVASNRRGSGSGHMKKSYACFYCTPNGLNFTSVKLYSRHMRELHMSGDGLYACPSCPTILPTTLKKINEHMKRKSHSSLVQTGGEVGRRQGPILAQLLEKNQNLDETVVKQEAGTNSGSTAIQKWFQCKACFILVESKEKLIIHQRTHTKQSVGDGVYESAKPTRFEDETDYVKEAEERRSPVFHPNLPLQMPLHKCKLCTVPTWHRTMGKLEEHVRVSHPGGPPNGSGPTPPGMMRRPSPRSRAKPAAQVPSGGVWCVVPGSSTPAKPGGGRKMTCLFCFTVFTKQRIYIKHMNEEHTDESGCFVCPKCPHYSTPLLSRATKHIRRHSRPDAPPPHPLPGKKKRKGKLRRIIRRKGEPVPPRTATGTIQLKSEPS